LAEHNSCAEPFFGRIETLLPMMHAPSSDPVIVLHTAATAEAAAAAASAAAAAAAANIIHQPQHPMEV
jgi:hypothetical protein